MRVSVLMDGSCDTELHERERDGTESHTVVVFLVLLIVQEGRQWGREAEGGVDYLVR